MVRVCVLCKKEQNPFESRSFHKFPADDELRKKWISAIGLSSVTKNTVICEDHFDESSFHNTDGYTVRRRLLSNAEPKSESSQGPNTFLHISDLKNSISSIDSDHNYTKCYEHVNTKASNDINNQSRISFDNTSDLATNGETECIEISDEIIEKNIVSNDETVVNTDDTSNSSKSYNQNMTGLENTLDVVPDAERIDISDKIMINVFSTDSETSLTSADESADMDNTTDNRKRKLPPVNVHSTKRIRYKIGFQTQHLSRGDFVSDESWGRFLRYHIDSKRQLKSAKKTNARKQKRLYEYKLLISSLI